MSDTKPPAGDYFSPEAIAARRAQDTPEIAEALRVAQAQRYKIDPDEWDGKKKKK